MKPFVMLAALGYAGVVIAGCRDGPASTAPAAALSGDLPAPGARGLTVMTRNLYIGTSVEPVIAAAQTDPSAVPGAVAAAYQTFLHTDFKLRAEGIADEIAANHPHVVALQELSLVRIQRPADFVPFNAVDVVEDFLSELQTALDARGVSYIAYTIEESDVEVPMLEAGPSFADVRLTDYDALLVRADVPATNVTSGHYTHLAPLFGPLPLLRGWIAADVPVGGVLFHVLGTHLESDNPAVSGPQAGELVAMLQREASPVVLLGDFNSGPGAALDAYNTLTGAGYVDVWTAGPPRGPGLTCCSLADLSNPATTGVFNQRLDLVLVRDRFPIGKAGIVGGAGIAIVGEDPADRVLAPGGYSLWPSDHAGVVATLRLPPVEP